MTRIPIKRALISVYDKTGLEDLARGLHRAGTEIVSTGSTAATIERAGVPVIKVEDLTGFPEFLDGRVKTLHPKVHGGLLADPGIAAHEEQLRELDIAPFQLLVSNLYPFERTVASGAYPEEVIEQIDIGGPAMVRAAAKNHRGVAVVTDIGQYPDVLKAVTEGGYTLHARRRLAAAAYARTAAYDAAVASWFAASYAPDETAEQVGWPDVVAAVWRRADVLRYGENPHQKSAIYRAGAEFGAGPTISSRASAAGGPGPSGSGVSPGSTVSPRVGSGIAGAELLHGKAMSYNNYVDEDAARRAAYDFGQPCVAIIKH
ncbi:MAG TPA: hypothetical protein VF482_11155, partial [Trebonia sp.]